MSVSICLSVAEGPFTVNSKETGSIGMPQKIPMRRKKRNPVNHVADQKNMKYRGEEIDKNAKI